MAVVKVLARDWMLEIEATTGVWKEIKGLTSLAFGSSKTDADTKTFDSNGWDEHIVAGRGRTLTAEGKYLEDKDTGARDPGQAACDLASDMIGNDSLKNFRLTSPGGVIRSFTGSVNIAEIGGSGDDSTSWGVEITISGPASIADVAVTAIAVTPATLTLAIGDVSGILATAFTPVSATDRGLTYVSDDDTVAAVTAEGRVVGVSAGSATITITADGGTAVTDTVAVTVSGS